MSVTDTTVQAVEMETVRAGTRDKPGGEADRELEGGNPVTVGSVDGMR